MLVVLLTEENHKLYELQSIVAKLRLKEVEKHDNVSRAKLVVEATDEYRDMKKQEAFIEMIWEFIRVSKKQAEVSNV